MHIYIYIYIYNVADILTQNKWNENFIIFNQDIHNK